jgi:hypothetical protein
MKMIEADEDGWRIATLSRKTGGRKAGSMNKTREQQLEKRKSQRNVGRPKGIDAASRDTKPRKLSIAGPSRVSVPVPIESVVESPSPKRKTSKVYTATLIWSRWAAGV